MYFVSKKNFSEHEPWTAFLSDLKWGFCTVFFSIHKTVSKKYVLKAAEEQKDSENKEQNKYIIKIMLHCLTFQVTTDTKNNN